MKLYKLTYETEVVILAEDENEAISNAEYYVKEETPELMDLGIGGGYGTDTKVERCNSLFFKKAV